MSFEEALTGQNRTMEIHINVYFTMTYTHTFVFAFGQKTLGIAMRAKDKASSRVSMLNVLLNDAWARGDALYVQRITEIS